MASTPEPVSAPSLRMVSISLQQAPTSVKAKSSSPATSSPPEPESEPEAEPKPEPEPKPKPKPKPKPRPEPQPEPKPDTSERTTSRAEADTQAPAGETESLSEPAYDADYLRNPPPRYPRMSRRLGEQGEVELRVRVNAGGGPVQIELHRSSGHKRLDQAALNVVGKWQFVPAKRGSRAVAAWVIVPIAFHLGG